jgi:hypothetical protein
MIWKLFIKVLRDRCGVQIAFNEQLFFGKFLLDPPLFSTYSAKHIKDPVVGTSQRDSQNTNGRKTKYNKAISK